MNSATVFISQLLIVSACIYFVISENVNNNCVRKCCSRDSILSSEVGKCVKVNKTSELPFNICLVNTNICKSKNVVQIQESEFKILKNNTLMLSVNASHSRLLYPEDFCIEYLNSVTNYTALVCVDNTKTENIRELGEKMKRSNKMNETSKSSTKNICPANRNKFCKDKVPLISKSFKIVENNVLKYTIFNQSIEFSSKDFCVDSNSEIPTALICPTGNKCIRKCCPPDSVLSNVTKNCIQLNQTVHLPNYTICRVTSKMCPSKKTSVEIPENMFEIVANYDLVYSFGEESRSFTRDEYCLEFVNQRESLSALVCVEKNVDPGKMASTGMIISMPFLLVTFIAYALLPDRNLHMKALMFYVISLMFSYLLLVIIQLSNSRFDEGACEAIGYFCLFFFLVSFFWMNVICIDIWWGFSGMRGFSGSKKAAERKRFFIYCFYAWGVPVLHVLIVYLIDNVADQNSLLKPGIGEGQCFLKRGYPELMYLYGPMAILITINIVLFAITAIRIRRIKKDTSVLKKEDSKRHSYENDKQIFNLYVKLLFAMGVNWSMEIISWAVIWKVNNAPEAIWYLTDFCNAVYGVFIFLIFVFKASIWKLLKKRYYSFIGKPHLAHSMTMTNTTRVTSYSTANSSVQETPHGGVSDTSTLRNEA